MNRFRYTAWDGRRRVRLDADQPFQEISEYLSQTEDFAEAFDRLIRNGFANEEIEVIGVDELLERIRSVIKDAYGRVNVDHALDGHRRRLDELLEHEADAVAGSTRSGDRDRRTDFLERLPRSVRDATGRLRHYGFADRQASGEFEEFCDDADDVAKLSGFIDRYGKLFHGRDNLGFEDALELMDEIESLKEFETALFNRDFSAVDAGSVAALLGAETAARFENLREMMSTLTNSGYMTTRGGRMAVSPRGARKLGQLALREIYNSIEFDGVGRHESDRRGPSESDLLTSKPYSFGDAMHIDIGRTVSNALMRDARTPVRLAPEDFEVHETRYTSRSATVLLLDMSWSMSWEGRFAAAKKVAMAMETVMRTRHPRDYFAIVGFYTRAELLRPRDLPEATWNIGDPFTNLQDGLRMASDLLAKQSGRNKTVIVITDGQPTAYFVEGRLFCEWPMSVGGLSTRATVETLKEVRRVTRLGIRINTFMLDESPPLTAFVAKMTAINQGRAFYSTPEQLGKFLLVDYVGKRRKVI